MVSTAPESTIEQAAAPLPSTRADPIVLCLPESWLISDAAMIELCELNPEWDIEVTEEGWLRLMPGTGFTNSRAAARVSSQVLTWSDSGGGGWTGVGDGMVRFADGVMMAPDVSWVSESRSAQVPADHEGLLPVCPDFVVEVRSQHDDPAEQQDKMQRWRRRGVRLGWLIDRYQEQVWIYREGDSEPELLERPDTLSGEEVLPGLTVDLTRIWERR